jgi:hypothetical protein
LNLSPKSDFSARRTCPACGQPKYLRDLLADVQTVAFNKEAAAYAGRFPYKSYSMPFGGEGAEHYGPLKQCIIRDKEHEKTMRRLHRMVGEEGLTHEGSAHVERPTAATFEVAPTV